MGRLFMVYTSCHGYTIQGRAGFRLGRPFALGYLLGAKGALHAYLRHRKLSRWGIHSWYRYLIPRHHCSGDRQVLV